ncbi:hypothetical protein P171DRAFT_449792 [Karstenula rhodostoma CBS 690.94]|uniref:Uncharacterized protein n=1 Tax=Karstenula rhodostoma CBS 690.94 TaxID=1392251 RepID=A0A9P4P5F3_9PLEO|nr:hypothetical protein P171DRAFT_449792 [Karstenula rhodostoma CBS 690.94]
MASEDRKPTSTAHRTAVERTEASANASDTGVTIDEKDRITQRNAMESAFLRLPTDIRLCIYEFAVGGHIVEADSICHTETESRSDERARLDDWTIRYEWVLRSPWGFEPANLTDKCITEP